MSAFQSAGQRCSALRVLFLQQDVAGKMLTMIKGAMEELSVGDPSLISTDIGPVIDEEAQVLLENHIKRMRGEAKLLKQVKPGPHSGNGTFVGPAAFELDNLSRLKREVFGPVLHVIRFKGDRIGQVVEAINATGYGLTHGIHTRVDETRDLILSRVHAGNTYVNRNQIGAVVGVQPFGGEGLSGTGPKAGGPHYLPRFANETVGGGTEVSVTASSDGDLTAMGLSRRHLERVLADGEEAEAVWSALSVIARGEILERAAAALESSGETLAQLDPHGAEGIAQAAEYLRFYAAQAEAELAEPESLPGPTGERDELKYPPRGLVACLAVEGSGVTPLAAQAGAALAAGNRAVVWHDDERVALQLEKLLREAGVPKASISAIPRGKDGTVKGLVDNARVQAVAFAGPHEQAKAITRVLAESSGAIRPLIPFAVTEHGGGAPGCPLAGSPGYLHRFLLERAVSIDTTASGGNASLFTME
jgi:RHH-type proline utilization regulon transcriptional repressor/proline dehydrogenase/delta 1-pyrroline-5-carboxylate dehydrogenase